MHWLVVSLIVVTSVYSLGACLLNPDPLPPVLYARLPKTRKAPMTLHEKIHAWMQVLITVSFTASALWIILSGRYDAGAEKVAVWMAGLVFGYWLPHQTRKRASN